MAKHHTILVRRGVLLAKHARSGGRDSRGHLQSAAGLLLSSPHSDAMEALPIAKPKKIKTFKLKL